MQESNSQAERQESWSASFRKKHRIWRGFVFALLSLSAGLLHAQNTTGFTLNPYRLHPPGSTLHFVIQGGTENERRMVEATMREWTRYANLNFAFHSLDVQDEAAFHARYVVQIECPEEERINSISHFSHRGNFSWEDGVVHLRLILCEKYWQDDVYAKSTHRETVLHEVGHLIGLMHPFAHRGTLTNFQRRSKDVGPKGEYLGQMIRNLDAGGAGMLSSTDQPPINQPALDSVMNYPWLKAWLDEDRKLPARGGILTLSDRLVMVKLYPGRISEAQVRQEFSQEQHQLTQFEHCSLEFLGHLSIDELHRMLPADRPAEGQWRRLLGQQTADNYSLSITYPSPADSAMSLSISKEFKHSWYWYRHRHPQVNYGGGFKVVSRLDAASDGRLVPEYCGKPLF